MSVRIDLNADLGEDAAYDEELLALVTSANIACGYHAGDAETMQRTVENAAKQHVAVGAHPGFADRANFGRRDVRLSDEELRQLVREQLETFHAVATAAGVQPRHVKPHGALYNMAARDPAIAESVAGAVAEFDRTLMVFAPPSSALAVAAAARGLKVAREVFADRNYLADGSLVPRTRADALLHDASQAAARVVRMLREGVVRAVDGNDVPVAADTVCVHGDTPAAVAFVIALRAALQRADVVIASPR